jgi:ElaB/YqjD/DUF883 family membrane-anchored ribosome-binding protein
MDERVNESASSNAAEGMGDRAARVLDQAKTAGRSAVDTIDDKREAAARKLSSTASQIHAKASESAGGTFAGAAHKTADTLQATADFMRDHPVSRMKDDLESLARRNPGMSLLVAAGVGFLLGRALTRD